MTTLASMLPLAPTEPEAPPTDPGRGRATPPALDRVRRRGGPARVQRSIGAALVPVPYVALRPGSVRPVTRARDRRGRPELPAASSRSPSRRWACARTSLLEALAGLARRRRRRAAGGPGPRRSDARTRTGATTPSSWTPPSSSPPRSPSTGWARTSTITTTGAIVRAIAEGSPAEDVLELDDVIVAVDGEPVDEIGEVGDLLQPGGPGATHTLTVERPAGQRHPGRGGGDDDRRAGRPDPSDHRHRSRGPHRRGSTSRST